MSRLTRLLQVLTLRCEGASELASRELDEDLPRVDRVSLLCHVLVCNSCRRFRKQIRVIRESVSRRDAFAAISTAKEVYLSSEARHRISNAIREASHDGKSSDRTLD